MEYDNELYEGVNPLHVAQIKENPQMKNCIRLQELHKHFLSMNKDSIEDTEPAFFKEYIELGQAICNDFASLSHEISRTGLRWCAEALSCGDRGVIENMCKYCYMTRDNRLCSYGDFADALRRGRILKLSL